MNYNMKFSRKLNAMKSCRVVRNLIYYIPFQDFPKTSQKG